MSKTIEAVFDGAVFRPAQPLALEPNTRVWISIETAPSSVDRTDSFLRTARSLNLDGPADWSVNLERYLYDGKIRDAG